MKRWMKENDRDCDINLVAENFITITPVHFDLTRFDYIEMLGGWKFGPMGGKGNER